MHTCALTCLICRSILYKCRNNANDTTSGGGGSSSSSSSSRPTCCCFSNITPDCSRRMLLSLAVLTFAYDTIKVLNRQPPAVMGVDHGRGRVVSRGDKSPELGVGDANANCPTHILSFRYKTERSVSFKIHQNQFPPQTFAGGAHDIPRASSRLRGDTPPHILPHSAPTHLWRPALTMRPIEFQPDLRLCLQYQRRI